MNPTEVVMNTAVVSAPAEDALDAALAAELEKVIANGEDHIMQFFRWSHLQALADARHRSAAFGTLAMQLVQAVPRNPERTVALRKLLEAKDAAVRAALAEDPAAVRLKPA